MTKKTVFNGLTGETTRVDLTAEEQTAYDNAVADFNSKSAERKLEQIKEIRLQKLIESDYAWKTKRQAWRDIPQNNNTETEYDALLIRDADGNLTNTIWSDA